MSMSGGGKATPTQQPTPRPANPTGAQVYGGAMRDAALQGQPIDISQIVGTVNRGLPAGAPGTNAPAAGNAMQAHAFPMRAQTPDNMFRTNGQSGLQGQMGGLFGGALGGPGPYAQQYGGLMSGMLQLPGGGFGYGASDPAQLARYAALQSLFGGLFPGGPGYGLLGGYGGFSPYGYGGGWGGGYY